MPTPPSPKRGRDVTRTARQDEYLERLEAAKGKRIVVDLDAAGRTHLETLQADGYASTQSDVVRKALQEAHTKLKKRKKT